MTGFSLLTASLLTGCGENAGSSPENSEKPDVPAVDERLGPEALSVSELSGKIGKPDRIFAYFSGKDTDEQKLMVSVAFEEVMFDLSAGNGQKLPLTESSDGIFEVPDELKMAYNSPGSERRAQGEMLVTCGLGESGSIIYHFHEEGAALKQVTILWNDGRKPAASPENEVCPPA